MNNKLIAVLLVILSLTLLVGCNNKTNTDLPDNNIEIEDNNNVYPPIESEKNNELYITFDAYGEAWKFLAVTELNSEGIDTVHEIISWMTDVQRNEKIKDALTRNNIISIEPIVEGDIFEGWIPYKEITTLDEAGYDVFKYEKLSGDTLFSTDEVLEMTVTEYNLVFIAKWASVPMEDYKKEEYTTKPEMDTGYFSINANGGMLILKDEQVEDFKMSKYDYWLNEGETLQDAMTGSIINSAILTSVEKENSIFDGWTVYETDYITWASEKFEEEGVDYILYDENNEFLKYIVLTNKVLYGSNLSTEDIIKIKYEGKSYYAIANWK